MSSACRMGQAEECSTARGQCSGRVKLDARWINICSYGLCSYYPLESPGPFTSFFCPCSLVILTEHLTMANLTGLIQILIIALVHCCCASHTPLSVSWVCINLLLNILKAKSQRYLIKRVLCLQLSGTRIKGQRKPLSWTEALAGVILPDFEVADTILCYLWNSLRENLNISIPQCLLFSQCFLSSFCLYPSHFQRCWTNVQHA